MLTKKRYCIKQDLPTGETEVKQSGTVIAHTKRYARFVLCRWVQLLPFEHASKHQSVSIVSKFSWGLLRSNWS